MQFPRHEQSRCFGATSSRFRPFAPATPVGRTAREHVLLLAATAAILWGCSARGAFFKWDLLVYSVITSLLIFVLFSSPDGRASLRWWGITASVAIAAILASTSMNQSWGDAGYAIAPVVAAVGLGAYASTVDASTTFWLQRAIANVTALVAFLGWFGVAAHVNGLAELQNQGWRATGPIGYANTTALVLLIGLLCATHIAGKTGAVSDSLRCVILASGLLATQSRSALAAALVCTILLWFKNKSSVRALSVSFAAASTTFFGLLPAVHQDLSPWTAASVAAIGLTACLLLVGLALRTYTLTQLATVSSVLLPALALGIGILLRSRLLDQGSDLGHERLWLDGLERWVRSPIFGEGPEDLGQLSRGEVVHPLFHNDLLQYLVLYGIGGGIAVLFALWRFVGALSHTAKSGDRERAGTGSAVTLALALTALVDFPMQIPVVLGVTALSLGTVIRPVGRDP
jgi:hypothetical protein